MGSSAFHIFRLPQRVVAPSPPSFANQYSTLYDGVNDRVLVGTGLNSVLEYDAPWCVGGWYYITAESGTCTLFSNADWSGVFRGIFAGLSASTGVFDCQLISTYPSNWDRWSTTLTNFKNVWMHLLVYWDGEGSLSLVRDGVPATMSQTVNTLSATLNSGKQLGFGAQYASHTSPGSFWKGYTDELAVWDSNPPSADVYNGGAPHDLKLLASPPVSWWRCGDGDTDPTWLDQIGANNGTMTDGPTFELVVP